MSSRSALFYPKGSSFLAIQEVERGYSPEDITEDRVQSLVVEVMQSIAQDYLNRLARVKDEPALLEKGFWYATDYWKIVVETGNKEAKDALIHEAESINEDFLYYKAPEKVIEVYSKFDPSYFIGLKKETSLSSTLNAYLNGPFNLTDCTQVVQLVRLIALRVIFGSQKFDYICRNFQDEHPLITNHMGASISTMFTSVLNMKDEADVFKHLKLGDHVVVCNTSLYQYIQDIGLGGRYHSICIEAPEDKETLSRFTAFGISAEGLTLSQFKDRMTEDCIAPRLETLDVLRDEVCSHSKQNLNWKDWFETLKEKALHMCVAYFGKDYIKCQMRLHPTIFRLNVDLIKTAAWNNKLQISSIEGFEQIKPKEQKSYLGFPELNFISEELARTS